MNVKPGYVAKPLHVTFIIFYFLSLTSCSISTQICRQANKILIKDSAISTGHIGISIYEPATETYWCNYQADKYFVPASDAKLFTLYAGLKYLGDSVRAMKIVETGDTLLLIATGDPTLLHPSFSSQPLYDYLASSQQQLKYISTQHNFTAYGTGWAWDDYNESYMPERSALPVFGNMVTLSGKKDSLFYCPKKAAHIFSQERNDTSTGYMNTVHRNFKENDFYLSYSGSFKQTIKTPFATSDKLAFELLQDSLHKKIAPAEFSANNISLPENSYNIYSRPVDSLLKPMMYYSDNLFAEQTLLMTSNEHLGYMDDTKMIDTLLNTDLKDIPQKPRWVDGSGLSRYNLFTAQSFVYILNKMKNEFGLERLTKILPTGGQGTLKNYYVADSLFLYAKTGSMSNVATISGFLITKKGKLLIFSMLANNFITRAIPVRRAVEKFLKNIQNKY